MRIAETILDIVYPPTCLSCGKDGFWVCQKCMDQSPLFHHAYCPRCGQESHEEICEKKYSFDSLLHMGPYADPLWRLMVTRFKYKSARCLERAFVTRLQQYRESFLDAWPWSGCSTLTVVPVPSSSTRVRERGFAHTDLLAQWIQQTLVPWARVSTPLKRTHAHFANAQLPSDAYRQANVSNAFVCETPVADPVLLIDDVFTTGATVASAAEALRRAGAPTIHVLTFTAGR
ncbi:MAG: double zinc ribbon domain-containing protein [bacterium]|nr:double zinc ribbon domain-containing protein [bacterium]